MILYQTLSKPEYDPSTDYFFFSAKIGDDNNPLYVQDILFESEEEAWAVYKLANKQFEFVTDADINELIGEMRS